jgi:hypothetical protein
MTTSTLYLPCNSVAHYDGDFSYRCENCFAVIGSVGQPNHCVEIANKYKMFEKMGHQGWDYEKPNGGYEYD